MKVEGGCYCGKVRYAAEGEPMLKAQCHCRECQYISGGAPNMFMLMPPSGFSYVRGEPKQFSRSDLDNAVTREFCADCGTHLTTRRPGLPAVILKVGTLDDPKVFGKKVQEAVEINNSTDIYWDNIAVDNLKDMDVYIEKIQSNDIFEIDSLDDLEYLKETLKIYTL